jgi:AhpD family alkylhydroperoxidase
MSTSLSLPDQPRSVPAVDGPHGPHRLRLAKVTRLPTLLLRLMAWAFRKQLGKVMTAIPVIYARFPRMVFPQLLMLGLVEKLSLDKLLVALVQTRVSMTNGCTFCADLHEAYAVHKGQAREKFTALGDFERSPAFDARERAVLRYAHHVALDGRVPDDVFAALRAQLSENEVVQLTWLCAFTTYLNRMAVPLGIGSDGFCALLPPS